MTGYCLFCGRRLHWLRHWASLYCDKSCSQRQQRAINLLERTTPDGRAIVDEASRGMRAFARRPAA